MNRRTRGFAWGLSSCWGAFPTPTPPSLFFKKPQPLRTLDEIRADILAVEKEAEGLLDELLAGTEK